LISRIFSLLALVIPPCKAKNLVLNFFKNVSISTDSSIGHSYISAKYIQIGSKARIKNLVRIKGVNQFVMKDNSFIGNRSSIFCGRDQLEASNFTLGSDSALVLNCLVELSEDIVVGNNVVFGGTGTQLWTHGFDNYRNKFVGNITFGNNIYINPSVFVCSDVSIAPGAVVTGSIDRPGFYGGVPARLIREATNISELEGMKVRYTTAGLPEFYKTRDDNSNTI
jgi:acetyltransferase-like isoleucine patch superfamily enzyme